MRDKIVQFGRIFLVLPALAVLMVGCDRSEAQSQRLAEYVSAPVLGVSNTATAIGKTKATKQFIAKKWQLVSMNDEPIVGELFLDLTEFGEGRGKFYDRCEQILVDFNTNGVSNKKLAVAGSARQYGLCDSKLIENMMWMLSEIQAFERDGDDLIIQTVQDSIRFKPLK